MLRAKQWKVALKIRLLFPLASSAFFLLVLLLPVKQSSAQESPPATPSISAFSPAEGEPGTVVEITGQNLSGVTAVRFGTINATFSGFEDGSRGQATVPAGAVTAPIAVYTPAGKATSSQAFVVPVNQSPRITSFTPTSGPAGTSVQIQGDNLNDITSVQFNGINAAFSSFSGSLSATVPANATSGPISITTPFGTTLSATAFTVTVRPSPVVTSVSPNSGKPGSSVQIRGNNLTGVTSVTFNGASATYTLFSGIIFATIPQAATTGPISVTTSGGTFTTTESFTVLQGEPPVINAFSPAEGSPGTSVQITGNNLAGATSVKFGDASAAFSFFGNALVATVPTNAVTSQITVTTPAGSATSTATFTVFAPPPPRITSFSPTVGEIGESINIQGENLQDATSVQFNGASASFTTVFGAVSATVPTNALSGPITIITPAGTNTTTDIFTVTNRLTPYITSVSPLSGMPGDFIDIRGLNLTNVLRVDFGATAASFLEFSPERTFAYVPTNALPGKITVTTQVGGAVSSEEFVPINPQPAEPPALSINWLASGEIELSWPSSASSFKVQSKADIDPATPWTDLNLTPTPVGNQNKLALQPTGQTQFFRLSSR